MSGHHWDMSKRIGGSQPRLDRKKMIPNPIRMYAEIADLDFMMFPPQDEFYTRYFRSTFTPLETMRRSLPIRSIPRFAALTTPSMSEGRNDRNF